MSYITPKDKPLILISNDDGIRAKGITVLTRLMQKIGNVIVVAPNSAMSGMSNAITSEAPLFLTEHTSDKAGLQKFSCNGTPTDCIKLGLDQLFEKKPDLIVSGINHGLNTSTSVIYSGTVGVALEGCVHGIPSVAFSIDSHDDDANFEYAEEWICKVINNVLKEGIPVGTCLNVNIPEGEIVGVEIRRQGRGKWVNEMEKRINPRGKEYYWLTGSFKNEEEQLKDTDLFAISEKKISITPIKVDMTDHEMLAKLKNWKF